MLQSYRVFLLDKFHITPIHKFIIFKLSFCVLESQVTPYNNNNNKLIDNIFDFLNKKRKIKIFKNKRSDLKIINLSRDNPKLIIFLFYFYTISAATAIPSTFSTFKLIISTNWFWAGGEGGGQICQLWQVLEVINN